MKAKLKNANGFVRFLLNHGEKIGIAAVLAVAGLLIYKSLGRETLGSDKQAAELKTAANQAQQRVTQMTWESLPPEEKTDSAEFVARSGDLVITPVDPDAFPRIDHPNPPVIPPLKLRSDPVLLAPTDVEVNGDSGLWLSARPEVIKEKMIARAREAARERQEAEAEAERAAREAEEGERRGRRGRGEEGFGRDGMGEAMGALGGMKTRDGAIVVPPQGGAELQGYEDITERSWVTVLAKIPIEAQFQMYTDALGGAAGFNATNDQPQFMGYVVQRAEVTADGQGPWEQLNAVSEADIIRVVETWPINTPEMVNPKYVHPLLTFPLPPMVMREWDDSITHSEMPIQTPEEIAEEEMRAMEELQKQPEVPEGEVDPDDPFGGVIARNRQAAQQQYLGGAEFRGGRGGEMGYMGGRGMGGPMYGGEMGRGGMEGRGMGGMGMGGITQLAEKQWDGKTSHYLFRYFDSTVEPGRRYRYRVRLAFVDVNAQPLPARFLSTEVNARLEKERQAAAKAGKPAKPTGYRLTEWSEPSPVAVVPESGLAYLANVKPANENNINSEPEARLVVKALDALNAAEVALHDWFRRGAVLNRTQQAQIIWSSLYEVDPTEPQESPEFDFITGQTLVDFDGGEPLSSKNRDLTAPARALMMDSAGRLRLRNELADEESVRPFDYILEQSEAAARQQRDRNENRGREGGFRGR